MKMHKLMYRLSSSLFVFSILGLLGASTVLGQKESLGTVGYAAPKGFTKTLKENVVAFSSYDQATGKFCIITLYGATPGTGKPESDFKREWANIVLKNMKADASPKTETETENGWIATGGGSAIEFEGGPAFALLTVITGGNRTVSILGVFNDPTFAAPLAAFSDSIELGKAVADVPAPQVESPQAAPQSSAAVSMSAAGLVGEFENNEIRASQQYAGKQVRITGIVNIIEINRAGQVVLTFKSSITTSGNARCYFAKSQTARVGALNAHEQATVQGRVKGLGDGFENSKAYLVLEDCIVP